MWPNENLDFHWSQNNREDYEVLCVRVIVMNYRTWYDTLWRQLFSYYQPIFYKDDSFHCVNCKYWSFSKVRVQEVYTSLNDNHTLNWHWKVDELLLQSRIHQGLYLNLKLYSLLFMLLMSFLAHSSFFPKQSLNDSKV